MGFSEIILLMVIALILFGPEDLPDIARTVGRVIYEIRKATSELTGGFSDIVQSPADLLTKAFDEKTNRSSSGNNQTEESGEGEPAGAGHAEGATVGEDEELLDYEGNQVRAGADAEAKGQTAGEMIEEKEAEKAEKTEKEDPLAELPSGVVSYEEKDASR